MPPSELKRPHPNPYIEAELQLLDFAKQTLRELDEAKARKRKIDERIREIEAKIRQLKKGN